jgi:trk system potassium uptake protein TrkA
LVIHPEESAANEVIRLIRRASATDVIMLADDRLHLVGLRLDPDSPAIGRSIQDLSSGQNAPQFRIMALARGIRTILPTGDERLRKNDQLFILGRPKSIPPVLTLLGKSDRRIENVMILGGSEIGAKVAFQLSQEKHKSIKLIVSDRQRAEELAELLGSVLVIHGEHTDIDLLVTEGLSDMDAFVAVTNDEVSNLVTCLLAKHLQVRKTVGLLSKGAYIPISQSIGLDAAVNKKLAVSREIMRFLRGKHVKSVASVHGLDAEILEIEANQNAAITQDMLMNVSMPRGVLIAALIRGKNVEIATGLTQIEAGDRVYVFVLPESISKAERLFERR